MNFDLKAEFKFVVLNDFRISSTYTTKFPNTKYSLDLIINELLYFLKSGVSWNQLRSPINYKTLFWHFNRFLAFGS